MDIVLALEFLFPGITFGPGGECGIENTHSGPQIIAWGRQEAQPTAQELADAVLPAARAHTAARIKIERDRRKFEGVPVGEHRFHSDADSRTQQLGLVLMGANLPAVQWKTLGGAFVTMTPTLAQQIFSATATRDIAIFAVAEAHIAALAQIEDPAAVLAYDYSGGWPA